LKTIGTADALIELWNQYTKRSSEAEITLSSEDLSDAYNGSLQLIQKMARIDSDIPKIRQFMGAYHHSFLPDQKREASKLAAEFVTAAVQPIQDPLQLLSSLKSEMEKWQKECPDICFVPSDFAAVVQLLAGKWGEICSETVEAFKPCQDFGSFQRIIGEQSGRLKERLLAQENGIREVARACSPEVSERVEGLLKAALAGEVAILYEEIQQKVLSIVLPKLTASKTQEELAVAASQLRLLKVQMQGLSAEMRKSDEMRRHHDACLKMIDESLMAIEGKMRYLPPEVSSTTTTHVLSHNVVNINGLAQTALMSALAWYAAPPLISMLGPVGVVAAACLPIAASSLINVGTSIVAPVGSFIDRQCDKLPEKLRTPMKYVWRTALSAGAIYCAYKTYSNWSTKTITPVAEEGQKAALATTIPQAVSSQAQMPKKAGPAPLSQIASNDVGKVWTSDVEREYQAAVASGKGKEFLDSLQRGLGYQAPEHKPISQQAPSHPSVPVLPPSIVSVPSVVPSPIQNQTQKPFGPPELSKVESEGVGTAWTPEIDQKYKAAIASGNEREFLDALQKKLGYRPPVAEPSPQQTPSSGLAEGPVQASLPAEPPVAQTVLQKSIITRIKEGFNRGRRKMKETESFSVPFTPSIGSQTATGVSMGMALYAPLVGGMAAQGVMAAQAIRRHQIKKL